MNRWVVIGKGKDTHRQRRRIYFAPTEAEAHQLAVNDGTIPESVVLTPDRWARQPIPDADSNGSTQPIAEFRSRIYGVSHANDDGYSRQAIIAQCQVGEKLYLDRDPDNPADPCAITIHRKKNGDQLGFLSRDLARDFFRVLDAGGVGIATIQEITGGQAGKEYLGVNIEVTIIAPEKLVQIHRAAPSPPPQIAIIHRPLPELLTNPAPKSLPHPAPRSDPLRYVRLIPWWLWLIIVPVLAIAIAIIVILRNR